MSKNLNVKKETVINLIKNNLSKSILKLDNLLIKK